MRGVVGARGPNRLSGGDAECKSDICSCLLKKGREKERGKKKERKANVCFGLKLGLNTPSDEL